MRSRILFLMAGISLFHACSDADTEVVDGSSSEFDGSLFRKIPGSESGLDFTNQLQESPDMNYFTYVYAYNGGGVAIGDIDGDGLSDVYLTGNQVRDRLYRNLGELRFEDITESALGPDPGGWSSGVTMADVNGDGHLDIYVCRSGPVQDPTLTRNLLYLNNGDLTFSEQGREFGIADTTNSTQAAFFDLENDGDLDLFVANHPRSRMRGVKTSEFKALIRDGLGPSCRLFRNEGGRFTDITREAGVQDLSYTLGLSIADIDRDGLSDLYLANDFDVADALWMAQPDGRFRNEIIERTRHISNFGMGCDIADLNNDGHQDIMVLDMTASDHFRSKSNMGSMAPMVFWAIVASGNHFQYMVNTLQLNNGNGTFSEIAQLAGVARTDWSWGPLFADLDNDGWKDLLITNGFKRDIRNNDYQERVYDQLRSGSEFFEKLDLVPSTRIRNYLFRNDGAGPDGRARLTFSDSSETWGFRDAVNSNGAAYGDLDNDGDLDLIINDLDAPVSLYENRADRLRRNHYLRLDLRAGEAHALGAFVEIRTQGSRQVAELRPTRGYQSAVEPLLHFGLGEGQHVDTLIVDWPNGKRTLLAGIAADQVIRLHQEEATAGPEPLPGPEPYFIERHVPGLSDHRHEENVYNDFEKEVLLPHQLSTLGPQLAVGDANGDGLEDVFTGSAHGRSSALLLQGSDGSFQRLAGPWEGHADQEHLGSKFFDADGDGDQDLLVLSGSNEHDIRSRVFEQRFYRNQGRGRFLHDESALPSMTTSAQRLAVADVDADGDLDVFIGGRLTPAHYPFAPRSYLLINDGSGVFSDRTKDLAPQAMGPGMITALEFADLDTDGDPDLVLAGEWMPLELLTNQGGHFARVPGQGPPAGTEGWWHALAMADLDGDGDLDIVAGNQGWNSKFQADGEHPLHIYWGDMDDNGRSDIVLAKEKGGTQLPVRGRECSSQQCQMILERFKTYDEFARADLDAIYTPEKLREALHLQATHMRSSVYLNDGTGRFTVQDLPVEAQFAPINGIVVLDVNADGIPDMVTAGNDWGAEVETVRYDGGHGLVLLGDGHGGFRPLDLARSGFFAWGHVKDLAMIHLGRERTPAIVVANNNDLLQVFSLKGPISAIASN
ncbi:MAG: VCBS repeat-containing protein [Flavobacteriales bacterium]|nr:VCBS repeat-containing protein [Flavobacteriales bacterium]